ncbi:hypothetical protein IQ265_22220 [Nodosilinea sp. LEGE 06152]|uniref:hypothetical protein n=1 Tax=Nodosilinea sp. LEGE 06152 TaxID=2777966 RepID=UPI001882D527|nr:hypothetical protein [Nodosilinea sp. LEGE 06152]MBE9159526.1 hypothetical protein [Nodosilinea sp. LEGE 06152]
MSSESPQNPLETLHSFTEGTIEGAIKEAIEEAHLLLNTLEDQIKLGFFTGPAATEIKPSDEQPSPLEDDSFRAD